MPLAMLEKGKKGTIQRLSGPLKTVKHLEDMGFVVGETVMVISTIKGNLIVEIKGTRLAMDMAMANRISVQI
ncbi:FeoA family protein [Clostridium neonatale]|uniref:FeoA family protein n=1 Tax=Clostridium neonatale TaxID=137838 RepID=UPI00291BB7A3|nr:FeoA family protein [Clostridium neonatale]CAI3685907.1 ferrous iron transport protein A [Clostridium neonatale]CAI3686873.1 ferrous iron transport protein A [Clostridium neonatale]